MTLAGKAVKAVRAKQIREGIGSLRGHESEVWERLGAEYRNVGYHIISSRGT